MGGQCTSVFMYVIPSDVEDAAKIFRGKTPTLPFSVPLESRQAGPSTTILKIRVMSFCTIPEVPQVIQSAIHPNPDHLTPISLFEWHVTLDRISNLFTQQ